MTSAKVGGGRRTRTFEVIRRLIYSQLPLPLGTLPRLVPRDADRLRSAESPEAETQTRTGSAVRRVYGRSSGAKSTAAPASAEKAECCWFRKMLWLRSHRVDDPSFHLRNRCCTVIGRLASMIATPVLAPGRRCFEHCGRHRDRAFSPTGLRRQPPAIASPMTAIAPAIMMATTGQLSTMVTAGPATAVATPRSTTIRASAHSRLRLTSTRSS